MNTNKAIAAALTLAVLCSAPARAAGTLGQNFMDAFAKAAAKLDGAQLDRSYAMNFRARLSDILKEAGCPSPKQCETAKPTALEAAMAKLEKLNAEIEATVKAAGHDSVAKTMQPKLDALKNKIDGSKLAAADKSNLRTRITNLASSMKYMQLPKIEADLAALAEDVDAAIALAGEDGAAAGIGKMFIAKAEKAMKRLDESPLNRTLKMDFGRKIEALIEKVCYGRGEKGKKISIAAKGVRADGRCLADPSTAQKAEGDLETLSAAVEAAVKEDGSKSMGEIYKTKVDALKSKLAKVDASLAHPVEIKLDAFLKSFTASRRVDAPDAAFDKLSAEVDAVVALAAEYGKVKTLAAGFLAKAGKVELKLRDSKLNKETGREFGRRLNGIAHDAGCEAATPAAKCKTADAAKLAKADDKLDRLSADIDKAIAEDGSKSMEQIYKPKIDALDAKVQGSTLASADKSRLRQRLMRFLSGLKGPVGQASKIEEEFKGIEADVEAALRLAK
ncbi:MAG: hypothetical protein HY059_23010 [Proteobacteria bacterium]|nr:hypothetical protein [Pseudomonadota bacterium]